MKIKLHFLLLALALGPQPSALSPLGFTLQPHALKLKHAPVGEGPGASLTSARQSWGQPQQCTYPLCLLFPPSSSPQSSKGHSRLRLSMSMPVQSEKERGDVFQRWWDPDWRAKRLAELKDPEAQFDKEHIEMATLMGVTPEELAKTLGNTAAQELDSSEYDELLRSCVKAAKSGDILGMVQARDLLQKMDEVGIKPNVTAYNGVISACATAAGGKFRECTLNDTVVRSEFIEKAATLLSFSGGRLDSKDFSRRFREKYPTFNLKKFLRSSGATLTISSVLRDSSRFEVKPSKDPTMSEFILVRKQKSAKEEAAVAKAASSANDWVTTAVEFLGAMRRNKVEPDARTYTALIGMCSRGATKGNNEMVEVAWSLFEEMKDKSLTPELPTFNALLGVCAGAGQMQRFREVEELMQEAGMEPDEYTFTSKMKANAQDSLESAFAVLDEMLALGFEPNAATFNLLMTLVRSKALRTEALGYVDRILEKMSEAQVQRDEVSFVTELGILAESAKAPRINIGDRAFNLLQEMKAVGCVVDVRAYTAGFFVMGRSCSTRKDCAETYFMACRPRLERSPCCSGSTKRQRNRLQRVSELFQEMRKNKVKPDSQAFTAYLSACAKVAKYEGKSAWTKAKEAVSLMETSKVTTDIRPYHAYLETVSNAARAPGGASMVSEAERIVDQLKLKGKKASTVTFNILLKVYLNSASAGGIKRFERAILVLDKLKREQLKPDVMTFNTLMGIAAAGKKMSPRKKQAFGQGLLVIEKMQTNKVPPETLTFNTLMRCCKEWGEVKLVRRMMEDAGGCDPNAQTYSYILQALRYSIGDDTEAKVMEVLDEAGPKILNAQVYLEGMQTLHRCKATEAVVKLLDHAKSNGVEPNAFMFSAALKTAAREKDGTVKELQDKLMGANVQKTAILSQQLEHLGLQ